MDEQAIIKSFLIAESKSSEFQLSPKRAKQIFNTIMARVNLGLFAKK